MSKVRKRWAIGVGAAAALVATFSGVPAWLAHLLVTVAGAVANGA